MKTNFQFQHLVLQQTLQDCTQEPAIVQPAFTLPITKSELLIPSTPPLTNSLERAFISTDMDETAAITASDILDTLETEEQLGQATSPITRQKKLLRVVALVLIASLVLAIFFTLRSMIPTAPAPTIVQQSYSTTPDIQNSNTSVTATSTSESNNTIQVYILGAVKHPGVYTLSDNARVYQLLQAAGGPLPQADMVELNLAAKLTDGSEIYVLSVGEIPPTHINSSTPVVSTSNSTPGANAGPLVNINTATETDLEQNLHVSATTAQKIITYRTTHGPYTAIDQLLQAISQSIYNRIKTMITV